MTPTEALQLIATPMRPDGTWNRDREACRQIAADALASMTTDPTAALKLARDALAHAANVLGLNGCYEAAARTRSAIAAIDALPAPSGEPAATGWLQDRGLLYRLTDERRPTNRDEIRVTMADGSRSDEACGRRAGELLDLINAAAQAAPAPQGDGADYTAASKRSSTEWHSGFHAGLRAGMASAQAADLAACDALITKVDALSAQAAPAPQAEPVARVMSWTNGSHSRNYRLEWLHDVPEGTELYAAPQPAPAVAAPVQPLTQREIDRIVNASREADDGPTQFVRRIERAHGITAPTDPTGGEG